MWSILNRIISAVVLLSVVSITAFAHSAFAAHTAMIEISGENKYKAVRLIPEIYNAANSDLSDILTKDSQGENVPYFINTGSKKVYDVRETCPMSLINSHIKDDEFYFDYKLTTSRESDTIATAIEFTT